MNVKRIFCFWEPRDAMTPYLKLCMRTWALNIPDYEITMLNYANLDAYIQPGTYDISTLKKFRLPVQKDAIMAAVLKEHGGIFMDADTLVTKNISPIVRHLRSAEVVLFGLSLSVVAARPHARLLTRWLKGTQERLARLAEDEHSSAPPDWDYLGNGVLAEVMTNMVGASAFGRVYEAVQRRQLAWPPWARIVWRPLFDRFWARRRGLLFYSVYRKYLRMLNRKRHGFHAEAAFYGQTNMSPAEQYRKFWFEEKLGVEKVFRGRQRLIGLHNAWTPEWYKALSEKEVLENDCLLSKTLKHLLAR